MSTSSEIRSEIEKSRKELLDLSLRNPLLNYRPSRARGVEMIGESTAQVFQTLVRDGRPMSFRPGKDDGDEDEDNPYLQLGLSIAITANQSDRGLQTAESPASLQKRLLYTYRLAKSAIEETGVNTLFLALGMLRWYESDPSHQERLAPLILVPVRLERTGVRERFSVRYTDDDLGVNLSLLEKAREDFGLTLPGQDALEPDDVREVDAASYIAQVADTVQKSAPDRWSVEPDRIALGFFSFSKLLMYLDLGHPAVEQNQIIDSLFGDGFREPSSAIPDDAHLDSHLNPQSTYHVLDADSSQSLAIHEATLGRNLVIQGPPGTGKSQTITNIIAESIARGKRVLFVSEKMAALEVVKRRLDNIGLGEACLELHSHKTNKRQTLDELKRTLEISPQVSTNTGGELLQQLARTRWRLNNYADAVNIPVGQSGVTPHDAFGELLLLGGDANPVSWRDLPGIRGWSKDDYARRREVVEELKSRLPRSCEPQRHPFWGSRLSRALLPSDQEDLRRKLSAAVNGLETLEQASAILTEKLGLNRPDSSGGVATLLDAAERAAAAPDLSGLNLTSPSWESHTRQIRELLEQGSQWQEMRRDYEGLVLPRAWNADLSKVREVLNSTGRSFFGRLFSSTYKQAERELSEVLVGEMPKDVDSQIRLIDALSRERRLRAEIITNYPDATLALGQRWNRHNTDWDSAPRAARWWLELLADGTAGRISPEIVPLLREASVCPGDENWRTGTLRNSVETLSRALKDYYSAARELQSTMDMDNSLRFGDPAGLATLDFLEQRRILDSWNHNLTELDEIISFNIGAYTAKQLDLGAIVAVAEKDRDAAESLTVWFDRAWYESVVDTAYDERPALRDFHGDAHNTTVDRFRTLDGQSLDYNRSRVAHIHRQIATHHRQLPDRLPRLQAGEGEDSETAQVRRQVGQLRVLQREIEKKSRHIPIRRLLIEAEDIIQELKPVFMMSPLSIASYLEPESIEFDLVVFDEASQVRPVDALGALFRAEKAVVVGDSKQLPPSSFFDRMVQSGEEAEDESVTADIESILGMFDSQGSPSRRLRWHYRSRHESLIAVSNQEFYDNNLVVFPSPDVGREAAGLRFHYLPDSVYDRSRSRANQHEAVAVADAVMEHAIHNPELSLGVAAFSQAQAQAIEDRLEILRRQDDSREEFFAAHPEEPFFVKNLENVQGDERDVIFISIGYGRDATGQVAMNFGPLNNQGGERRLNVLITRAKQQCHVFTNLRADDIDLSRSNASGVRAMKTFLTYAETNVMPSDVPYESDFAVDSPFQQAVAKRLEERGYQVHQEVASAGKFVDIGIVDSTRPGRYIIGIECDGASYHSSRSARDRDRLRENHLRSLGWELHRTWSTDWFRNPERELDRAVEAIERAKSLHKGQE